MSLYLVYVYIIGMLIYLCLYRVHFRRKMSLFSVWKVSLRKMSIPLVVTFCIPSPFLPLKNAFHESRLYLSHVFTFSLSFLWTTKASTFQMAILLQYNTEDAYTVQQLTDSTQIKMVFPLFGTHAILSSCLFFVHWDVVERGRGHGFLWLTRC